MIEGQRIIFKPGIEGRKPWRNGVYVSEVPQQEHLVLVRLDGDPFNVCVNRTQVTKTSDNTKAKETDKMATATKTKPKAKELRKEAKALGVEGWEDMDLDELTAAVEEAREGEAPKSKKASSKTKASTKKAKVVEDDDEDDDDEDDEPVAKKSSKKAAAKKATPAKKSAAKSKAKAKDEDDDEGPEEGANPYTYGTNLYWMAEALLKGGKVSTLVKNLKKKVNINPRTRTYTDEEETAELHRRLIIVSQHLRNDFGFSMEKEGRGADAVIRCYKD